MKKFFSAVLSIVLAIVIGAQIPVVCFADSMPVYVKEVKVASGSSAAEAKQILTDGGYTVVDTNLREGASGKVCYMGYKTTTDKSEAITDIRLMNQKGGFVEKKYRDLKKQWSGGVSATAQYFRLAVAEVKTNYEAGSPLAKAAVNLLDTFEVDGVKLSEYLFSSQRTDADFEDLVLICADNVVSTIYNAISLGTADYNTDSFAKRLSSVDSSKFTYTAIESDEDNAEYVAYWDRTERVIDQLQDFYSSYKEAVKYFEERQEDEEYEDEEEDDEEVLASATPEIGNIDAASAEEEVNDTQLLQTNTPGTNNSVKVDTVFDHLDEINGTTTTQAATAETTTAAAETTTAAAETTTAEASDGSSLNSAVPDTAAEPTQEEGEAYWKQFVDDKYKDSEDEEDNEAYDYACVMAVYEKLSSYASFDSKYANLAEYIYQCGNPLDEDKNESDRVNYRIYPLVSVLTNGQMFALQYGGVSTLVNELDSNSEKYEAEIDAATEEIMAKIKENGKERISVFYNVNREIYDETVAFTSQADRLAASNSAYEKLTENLDDAQLIKTLNNIIMITGIVALSVLGAAVLTLWISAAVIGTTVMTLIGTAYTAFLAGSVAYAATTAAMTTGAVVAGIVGTVMLVVVAVLVAVIVICVLIAVIKRIIDDADEEEEVIPAIPSIMFDAPYGNFAEYHCVTDQNGENADINCGSGSQWDAMYVSYSSEAGDPIEITNGFRVQTGNSTAPDGYMGIRRFEYTDWANLNSLDNSSTSLYIFYKGTAKISTDGSTYISDLTVVVESSREAARLALTKKGFIPVEEDISRCSSKVSYIGYKTTDIASEAITDIRVAYYSSAEQINFGTKADGQSAQYAFAGKTNNSASIYYTKQSSNGTPILADLRVTTSMLDADSGYEPVNMFSGGDAFNFSIGSNWYSGMDMTNEGNFGSTVYLYFRPSVSYGSDSPVYLSGYAFCCGYKDSVGFAAQCGFKIIEDVGYYNLTKELTYNPTYILYSTTHNPYRAITAIRTYEAGNSSTAILENLTVGGVGYCACETFSCIMDDGVFDDDYYRGLRPSNAYVTRLTYEGCRSEVYDVDQTYRAENNFGYYEDIPMMGLYVAGPNANVEPLKLTDIYYTKDPECYGKTSFVNSEGETVRCRPASSITDTYGKNATNLTFEWNLDYGGMEGDIAYTEYMTFSNNLRIFYRGSVPTRGKYVSGVVIATVDSTVTDNLSYSYEQCMAKLLANGEGEILKKNLRYTSSYQQFGTKTLTEGSESWTVEVCSNDSVPCSYMMVFYTDIRTKSIRAGVLHATGDNDSVKTTETLSYQNATYANTGEAIATVYGHYGFYTTKNGMLGSAVTDINLTDDVLGEDCTSIKCDNGNLSLSPLIKLKHPANTSETDTYINKLCVESKWSKESCLYYLYQDGCTTYLDQDKNGGLGGDYVYLGYDTTVDPTDPDLITGIQAFVDISSDTYTDADGVVWEKISGDLNYHVGGSYVYLYITHDKSRKPVTRLSTLYYMSYNITRYTELKLHNWTVTNNLSEGTSNTYKLCYRQAPDWYITEDGVLRIETAGAMSNYNLRQSILYVKQGAVGGMRKYVQYLPEWYEYADSITAVSIADTCTKIDDYAFYGCNNIQSVSFDGKGTDYTIQANSIPTTATVCCYEGSAAETYAKTYGLNVSYTLINVNLSGTAVMDTTSVIVMITIFVALVACGGVSLYITKRKKKDEKPLTEGGEAK